MAALARRLITRSQLLRLTILSQPPIINSARHLLSTISINSVPVHSDSDSTLNHIATDLIPKRTSLEELRAREYGGCHHKYWKVYLIPPFTPNLKPLSLDLPRDVIINEYIKILTAVLKSEEEAKKKIYSVSTRHFLFFVCQVPFETALQIEEVHGVNSVEPVCEEDLKDYSETAEPFIDGKAVEYDPIYHEALLKELRSNRGRPSRWEENVRKLRDFKTKLEKMEISGGSVGRRLRKEKKPAIET